MTHFSLNTFHLDKVVDEITLKYLIPLNPPLARGEAEGGGIQVVQINIVHLFSAII